MQSCVSPSLLLRSNNEQIERFPFHSSDKRRMSANNDKDVANTYSIGLPVEDYTSVLTKLRSGVPRVQLGGRSGEVTHAVMLGCDVIEEETGKKVVCMDRLLEENKDKVVSISDYARDSMCPKNTFVHPNEGDPIVALVNEDTKAMSIYLRATGERVCVISLNKKAQTPEIE